MNEHRLPPITDNRKPRLWRFHGGLHLADEKDLSTGRPIQPADLPERLVLPLRQHIGQPGDCRVKVGDKVLKGQLLADSSERISAPLHAPSSGTVVEIGPRPVPHPSGLPAECVVIETDGREQWAELPAALDWQQATPQQLLERIRWAGIVGLGGATFPTAAKLASGTARGLHTLIVNGAECEPYITCDDLLMREDADGIVAGIAIVLRLLGLERCLIGVEDNKPQAIERLRDAVERAGLKQTQVVAIPTLYPSGGEKQLIRVLTGREVPSGRLPADLGLVCHNVGTLAAVADAVNEGRPLLSRVVTVTGRGVAEPQNFEALIGTPINELIEQAGGYVGQPSRLILGGPMMGFALPSDQLPITKGANCVLVAASDELPEPPPAKPCIRCGKCAEVCPVRLLPQQLYWHARAQEFDKVQDYKLFDCIECGCCSHVCPSHIPLVQYYRHAKSEIWAREAEKAKADRARRRHDARQARLARLEAERKAKLRKKKEALEKKSGTAKVDPKKTAIEAAMKRAAEKKARLAAEGVAPQNTDNLTPAQQKQVDEANRRRAETQQESKPE